MVIVIVMLFDLNSSCSVHFQPQKKVDIDRGHQHHDGGDHKQNNAGNAYVVNNCDQYKVKPICIRVKLASLSTLNLFLVFVERNRNLLGTST